MIAAAVERPTRAPILLGQFPPGSTEWHAARATRIGGSEVAAILGISPWKSPYSLWHAKRNGWIDEPNDNMLWGTALEDDVLDWYFDRHGVRTGQGGTFVHPDRDWQLANPDALGLNGDDEPTIVEAKTARFGDDWGAPGTDEVPSYYRVQTVQYMDVLGYQRADIPVSIGGAPPVVYTVRYNAEEAVRIREQVAEFVQSLIDDVCPDLDTHPATYEAVQRLHPDIDEGAEAELATNTAVAYLTAKRNAATAERAQTEAAARLLLAMGRAQYATWQGTRIARRQAKGDGLPYPVLALKGVTS